MDQKLDDKWMLIGSFIKTKGMVRQHIDSFDYFVESGIKKIVEANKQIQLGVVENVWCEYKEVRVNFPSVEEDMCIRKDITPQECRLRDMTYSAEIVVDVEYVRNSKIILQNNIVIGRLPIMLRSNRCILRAKTEKEMAALQECPKDPGGYFIVNGTERVVLIQEQIFKNRILVEQDKDRNICATVTSSSEASRSRTIVCLRGERVFVCANKFTEDIPVVVMLRAMGIESDLEVVQLVGEDFIHLLSQSVEQCRSLGIDTSEQALEYIGNRVRKLRDTANGLRSPEDEARFILISVVLSHLPIYGSDFYEKAVYLGLMVRRMFLVSSGKANFDNKDYFGNKRLELAGQLIEILFEDLFKRFNNEVKRQMENALQKKTRGQEFDAVKFLKMRKDIITKGFEHTISTGNWTLRRFNMNRQGVTAVLSRLSYISALGHMTKVASSVEKNRKISGPRALQASQWGMLCPSDTPEGEGCGLIKNLAILAHITTFEKDGYLRQIVFDLGAQDIKSLQGSFFGTENAYVIFVNGRAVGVHPKPEKFIHIFRILRRNGKIQRFVSIFRNKSHKCVYISSDEGRVCRPLIIVDKGKPLLKNNHLSQLKSGTMTFDDFITEGILEYLDVNEENDALIALTESNLSLETTHLEIDEMTILGIVAGLIPYPHHNQSPRNTYQCAMGKQSMGAIGFNQHLRMDTLLFNLTYPQKPLVTTRTLDMVGFECLPAGQNAIVAVMSYSGYDIEDAIILNKASLDRGFGRCAVYRKNVTSISLYPNNTCDKLCGPPKLNFPSPKNSCPIDDDGFGRIGSRINTNDVLVNKFVPKNTISSGCATEHFPQPLRYSERNPAILDKVMATSNQKNTFLVKTFTCDTRRPELGDKFSSRHGQKGVCGLIVPECDLPFNECGMVPDMIMNPHGLPSRMTVGKMIELLAGKASVLDGRIRYGTAFGGDPLEEVCEDLLSHGYKYSGKERLTSGISGNALNCLIFMGPVYYQKLKHMVADKMHARARGPKTTLTRQPREGRSKKGGLRLGEMERDCLIAYGTSMLLQERLCFSSDQYSVSVCRDCGMMVYKEWCNYCKSKKSMALLKIPYACKLLFQELVSMNIIPRLRLREA